MSICWFIVRDFRGLEVESIVLVQGRQDLISNIRFWIS